MLEVFNKKETNIRKERKFSIDNKNDYPSRNSRKYNF